jgi:hypothetical protein
VWKEMAGGITYFNVKRPKEYGSISNIFAMVEA